jgi:putative phosphoribosyl transferase
MSFIDPFLDDIRFFDRHDAGRRLAELVYDERSDQTIVIGLPRGGVIVAHEVARALHAPLDTWAVRKLGAPFQPELAIGAIAEGGGVSLDDLAPLEYGSEFLDNIRREEMHELERRANAFHPLGSQPDMAGKRVIVVDDGVATGHTAIAALRSIKERYPERVVFAAPVGAPDSLAKISLECDRVACVSMPRMLGAVGFYYQNFAPTTDEEVLAALGMK